MNNEIGPRMNHRLDPILMAAAACVFVASTVAMLYGLEPFATWYYSFAWWSYILFIDAGLRLRRPPATIIGNPEGLRLMLLSIAIWASFELYNFRLNNWYYLELPPIQTIRWMGYALAYATVLPGIFVTWRWLQAVFPPRGGEGLTLPSPLVSSLFWGGVLASLLPWIWPRNFFPLVWLGPTSVFAAINYRLGGQGILRELEAHGPSKLYRLLAAGAICGFLWELWNFWARSKWAYEIPLFNRLQIFEMPLAGFLGFPPFALECHEMFWALNKGLNGLKTRPVCRALVWIGIAIFIAAVFRGIDRFTVRSFQ
jgi:hypothetical protein